VRGLEWNWLMVVVVLHSHPEKFKLWGDIFCIFAEALYYLEVYLGVWWFVFIRVWQGWKVLRVLVVVLYAHRKQILEFF
jgi:hypothetical protein